MQDPELGYYQRKAVFGERGDFVTAPEISQAFGEAIAVFLAWNLKEDFQILELGPGRGTLAADICHTLSKLRNPHLQKYFLYESSSSLFSLQCHALSKTRVPYERIHSMRQYDSSDIATVVLANEFFDALPIDLLQRRGGKFSELRISYSDGGSFALCNSNLETGACRAAEQYLGGVPDGEIVEFSLDALSHQSGVDEILKRQKRPSLALVIDYGSEVRKSKGTLKAIKNHQLLGSPFSECGDCDLSADVDFSLLRRATSVHAWRLMTQRDFLVAMKIEHRRRVPQLADQIDRLIDEGGMGGEFKVFCASNNFGFLYPFTQQWG